MEEEKFYLMIEGEKVIVSEEVYRAYVRPVWNEQRKKKRYLRCKVMGKKGNLIRCNKDCSSCKYALMKSNVGELSLETYTKNGYDIGDEALDLESSYIERETEEESKKKLQMAIAQLTPRQQEVVKLIFFEGKTQAEVAKHLGIAKQSMSDVLKRIYASLKKFLENF